MERFLILGNGYVGQHFAQYFSRREIPALLTPVDICQRPMLLNLISDFKPTSIINCAAKTGNPNVDACENDPAGTYRSNVEGAIAVAEIAAHLKIHLTHLGSGCIYQGSGKGEGFTEEDHPNFLDNTYLRSKSLAEIALKIFPVLQLRLRMPVSAMPNRRNLITKFFGFSRIMREPNSATIVEDFVAAAHHLIRSEQTGIFNVVNPGVEYHDDLLRLIEKTKRISLGCTITTFEALQSTLTVKRSNCILSCSKLLNAGFKMPDFWSSIENIVSHYPLPQ